MLAAQTRRELAEATAKSEQSPYRYEHNQLLVQLIRARQSKRLSQAALAARLGMPQSTIARIESGKGNPGLKTLLKIAKALDAHLVLE
jgi:DNA-binding XRE family transcriptional regulator